MLQDVQTLKKPFVILCYPRTGSYLLVDLLNQFSEIECHGEIYKTGRIELPERIAELVGYDVERRDQDPFGYLSRILTLQPATHTGFKLFPGHCKEAYRWAKHSPDIRRIALVRPPLEVYVSLERARMTGRWTDREGKSTGDKPKLHFDADKFDQTFRLVFANNQGLRKLAAEDPTGTKLIHYSQLTDPERVRAVARFLGVTLEPEKLEYRLHKQTTEKYSELFENFTEFQDHLAGKYPNLRLRPEMA